MTVPGLLASALVGYLIGSLPTANGVALLWGVNLRSAGSGNPGANNARRLGGVGLAIIVLIVELGKGVAAVFVGYLLAGDGGAVTAGIGAITGNVYNLWYRFDGGKGLAISGGVVIAAWPYAFLPLVMFIAVAALVTRSSGRATLAAEAAAVFLAVLWSVLQLPNGWGVDSTAWLIVLSLGLVALLTPKQWADAKRSTEITANPV